MLCSWARHFTLTVPLSTQVYKWVPANWGNQTNCGEVTCDGSASCPGEVQILRASSCYRNQDKLRQLWASLGSKASRTSLTILSTINSKSDFNFSVLMVNVSQGAISSIFHLVCITTYHICVSSRNQREKAVNSKEKQKMLLLWQCNPRFWPLGNRPLMYSEIVRKITSQC